MNETHSLPNSTQPSSPKARPPTGMILLCLYLIYSVFTGILTLFNPVMIFGPFLLKGWLPFAHTLVAVAAEAIVLFAILKRKSWTLKFALPWFSLIALRAAIHLVLSLVYRSELPALYNEIPDLQYAFVDEFSATISIAVGFIITLIVQGTLLWYLNSKRSYFNMNESENVASIDLSQYARMESDLVRRAIAAFLDYALFVGVVAALLYAGYFSLFLTIVFWFVYFVVFESIFGYTPFKGLFDLRIVRDNRKDFPLMVALKRHICDPLDFSCFGGVALLVAKLRTDHKRLGDLWAHSTVQLER